jgi:hypothetical protein
MYSQPNSTFLPDSTQAAEEQSLRPHELPNSTGPGNILNGEAIYLRLLNLWHAATSQTPSPSRMIVRQCPYCGALSASPDAALLRNWARVHLCQGRQHSEDAL